MKQMNKSKKKIFISLLFVCVVIGAFGAYAALSTSGTEKRVIAARTKDITDSNALRFSSNYLSPYGNNEATFKNYPISISSDSDATIGITVCNYPQGNPSLTNDKTITYNISMKVLDGQYEEDTSENAKKITMTSPLPLTLTGNTRSILVHKITIPKEVLQEISQGYIQVIVTPDQSSLAATSNNILAANLQIVPAATRDTAWVGTFGDSAVDFDSLDAYNYQISGTEQGSLTLTWNKNLVMLSDWSIQLLNPNATTEIIKSIKDAGSITFDVGGQNQPTSYMLQFYRAGTTKPSSFNDLKIELKSTAKGN